MEELALFLFAFVFSFLGRLTLYLVSKLPKKKKNKKGKKEQNGIAIEIKYLSMKFKIPYKRIDKKWFGTLISFIDALIISGTLSLSVLITDSITLELLIGLVLVMAFIYLSYEILGKILVMKGFDRDEL